MPHKICTHPWEYRAEPFRILGNLYYVGNRGVASHLIASEAGLILLDTGFPQTVYLLVNAIRQLGFDPADIRYIVNTHAHYDHVGGTRAIQELTGAETFLGRDDTGIVTGRPELTEADLYGQTFYEAYDVDHAVSDGDRITLGDVTIECRHAPGHTPGTMCYFFDVREGDATYRAGLHGGPGMATLSDAYLERFNLPRRLRDAYAQALARLSHEHVDVHLGAHPGQNKAFEKAAALPHNPLAFVDSTAWPTYIGQLQAAYAKRFAPGT